MEISRERKDYLFSKSTSMTEQAIVVALRSRIVLGFMTELTQSHQINSVYNLENSKLPFSVHSYSRVALETRLLKFQGGG
jgi:hypothetical protein